MSFSESAGSKSIDQREHNNDAAAKRVVQYFQDSGGNWLQAPMSLVAGVDYNFMDEQQTSATVRTYVYKSGGSGGTTVLTVTVTYTDSTREDIDTVEWS